MGENDQAQDLFAEGLKARDMCDFATAIKKFTMALSYAGDEKTYLELARTHFQVWNGGLEPDLQAILEAIENARERDKKGALDKQIKELFEEIDSGLRMMIIALQNDEPDAEDVQYILNEVERVEKFCRYAPVKEQLERVKEVASTVLEEREAEKRQWTLDNVYAIFSSANPNPVSETFEVAARAATEEEVQEFESRIGFRFPEDFREFTLSPLGGLYIAVHEELWPRPQLGEVGPFWTFLYGINVFGLSAEVPEWLDMRVQYDELQSLEVNDLVPFMRLEGDADMYCFDKKGAIVRWYHDDPDERHRIDLTFAQLLMSEINELNRRLKRKLELTVTGSSV